MRTIYFATSTDWGLLMNVFTILIKCVNAVNYFNSNVTVLLHKFFNFAAQNNKLY